MRAITVFERRMRFVFGLALSVLFGTVAVSTLVIAKLDDALQWVSHTHEVIAAVNSTQVQFTSARVNGKNYLITRQPKYMAMRNLAIEEFDTRLAHVLALTADNARQQNNVEQMREFSSNFFLMTTKYGNKVETSKPQDSEAIEFTDSIETEAAKVVSQFQVMRDEESRLLEERQKVSTNFVRQAYSVFPTMLLIQIVLGSYIYYGVIDQCRVTSTSDT